jgi:beta-glucosidase
LVLSWACILAAQARPGDFAVPPYKNAALPVSERVKDLLSRMTLGEKIAQMVQGEAAGQPALPAEGFVYADVRGTPEGNATRFRDHQKSLRANTRLGIPALAGNEALHGVLFRGATIYPQAIALGATWNPALVQRMGAEIAQEASACGLTQVLAPVLDLGRDPRYGRIEETYGECPTLVSRMGVAYLKGLQGENAQNGLAPDKVYGMAKHFAGYSVPTNGINIAPALIGERELRTHHLLPFEAAVKEAHLMAVMPGYNSVDAVPSHASPWLLTEVLRKEWGFQGYVYSDWSGIDFLVGHRVAADLPEAGLLALKAGVDLEAPEALAFRHLPGFIKNSQLDERVVDAAVARILRAKFLAGLFDGTRSDGDPELVKRFVHSPEHILTARALADESIILLKNEKGLLPLDATRLKSIAVIGPNAAQVQFGDYAPSKSNKDGVNFLEALKARYGRSIQINHAKGCDLVGLSKAGFAAATEAARASDVAVVVVGDTSMIFTGVGWEDPTVPSGGTVGEGYDVANPVLPGVQEDLVKAVVATGKPTVVILLNGRPYCMPWLHQHVPALVEAFYPGEQQGPALVDILFGRVNPSGRLPVTLARSAGHIPCTYDFKGYGRGYYRNPGTAEHPGRDYVFDSPAPLWPFGFGLSYTRFAYSELRLATPQVNPERGVLKFQFTVKNKGPVTGKVVPQVYWRQKAGTIAPPEKRLLRFEKIELDAGESRNLAFEVPVAEFRTLSLQNAWQVAPGPIELQVADNAETVALRGEFAISDTLPMGGAPPLPR